MRRFLSKRIPELRRVLFIESGDRAVAQRWLAWLAAEHPRSIADLVTCYEGAPEAMQPVLGAIYHVSQYQSPEARGKLVDEFRANRYDAIAVLATAEPVMTKWKWYLAWKVPSKVLLINENADWFWLDRGHWPIIREFLVFRASLSGSGALTQPVKLLLFPLTLAYLAAYALFVHARRKLSL